MMIIIDLNYNGRYNNLVLEKKKRNKFKNGVANYRKSISANQYFLNPIFV